MALLGLRVALEQIGGRYYLINTLFSVPEGSSDPPFMPPSHASHPSAVLYADLVELFDGFKKQQRIGEDVSYANIFNGALFSKRFLFTFVLLPCIADLRTVMDFVHLGGSLKNETLANLPKHVAWLSFLLLLPPFSSLAAFLHRYIKKDGKLPQLFATFRRAGKKSFLLTNSEWYYTNAVMAYLLDDSSGKSLWTCHFGV